MINSKRFLLPVFATRVQGLFLNVTLKLYLGSIRINKTRSLLLERNNNSLSVCLKAVILFFK